MGGIRILLLILVLMTISGADIHHVLKPGHLHPVQQAGDIIMVMRGTFITQVRGVPPKLLQFW